MLNNNDAKRLGRNKTINLKYMNAREYVDKIEGITPTKRNIHFLLLIVGIVGYIASSFFAWLVLYPQNVNASARVENMSIQQKIRLERLEICQKAYKKSGINKQFIYEQIPAVRCATYMGLIYAYESNFGKSRKCIQDKNCHGMKGNGIDTPKGFLKFKTFKQGREYFAKKYFRWHYKKNINIFVNNWSQTDRKTYKIFMKKRFWKMYGELEYFYLTGKKR